MITYYLLDSQRVFSGSVDRSERESVPANSVRVAPPEVTGTEVAQWTGRDWIVLAEYPTPPPAPEPVPVDVSAAAAREALIDVGLLDAVPAAIDEIPDATTRAKAKIWWEYATRIRRDSPWVAMLAPSLGLDDAALYDLFRAAAAIEQNA